MQEIKGVLISKEEISEKVKELAKRITDDYNGIEFVMVGVLKGGFVFLADLIREIEIPFVLDFIAVGSYGNATTSSGNIRLLKDMDIDITGMHVLIVEDMIDTGITLKYLKEFLLARGSKSVKACVAFDKPSRRRSDVVIEYKGIEVPDEFVVGYGLDYCGKFRNLPDLCILKPCS